MFKHFKSDVCNTNRQSWDNKRMRKKRTCSEHFQSGISSLQMHLQLQRIEWFHHLRSINLFNVPWLRTKGAMPKASVVCKQGWGKVDYIVKNYVSKSVSVSEPAMAKNITISLSTVPIISKMWIWTNRLAENQHWMPVTLNLSLQENRHQCFKGGATWAQKPFRKPLWVNRVSYSTKVKFFQTKPNVPPRNAAGFSGPSLICDAWCKAEKCVVVWWVRISNCFLGKIMPLALSGPKRKRTIWIVISVQFIIQHLWWNWVCLCLSHL